MPVAPRQLHLCWSRPRRFRAPIAAAPVATPPISNPVSESRPPRSPLPTPHSSNEPWDDELPELADLAPDLFKDELESAAAEIAPEEPAPQRPDEAIHSQFDAVEPARRSRVVIEELESPEHLSAPASASEPEPPPAPMPPLAPVARPPSVKPPAPAQKPGPTTAAPTVARGIAGPLKGTGLKAKAAATSPPASAAKAPARPPAKPRKPAPGLTGMGNPKLPSVDVFSQLPVDPDGGASIPQVTARAGFIPPGSESSRRPPGFRPPRRASLAIRPPPPAPDAQRLFRQNPQRSKPVIAEGMEDTAEQLPLPSEELLQQQPPELPPEQAAEPEKKKKKWKFPFLKMVLLGLTAGGGAGAWFGLPPNSDLVATMKFDGIKDFDARQHAEFALAPRMASTRRNFVKLPRRFTKPTSRA